MPFIFLVFPSCLKNYSNNSWRILYLFELSYLFLIACIMCIVLPNIIITFNVLDFFVENIAKYLNCCVHISAYMETVTKRAGIITVYCLQYYISEFLSYNLNSKPIGLLSQEYPAWLYLFECIYYDDHICLKHFRSSRLHARTTWCKVLREGREW